MAEKSVLTFADYCATNNKISADVEKNSIQDENRNVTDPININNSQSDNPINSSDICTQEEAGEEFLAGGNKCNSENDQHLSDAGVEVLEDEFSLKSDNIQESEAEEDLEEQIEQCEDQETNRASICAENDGNSTCETLEKKNTNR